MNIRGVKPFGKGFAGIAGDPPGARPPNPPAYLEQDEGGRADAGDGC